eukprot:m.260513 g.260513  ORF g.260513 m.260513 type:complete len:53 (-) comp40023_c0_seq1:175-333(-)
MNRLSETLGESSVGRWTYLVTTLPLKVGVRCAVWLLEYRIYSFGRYSCERLV